MNKRKSFLSHLLGAVAYHEPFAARLNTVCFEEDPNAPPGGTAAQAAIAAGGNEAERWYGTAEAFGGDAELFDYAGKQNFENPVAAFKKLKSLESMIGSNDRIALPKEGEDLGKWDGWDKLGAPKEGEAAKYAEVVKPSDYQLPEGMAWDQPFMDAAFDVAAKARIPVQQIKPLADLFVQQRMAEFQVAKEADRADREALDQLKTNWGAAADANLELARRGVRQLFGEKADQVIGLLSLEGGSALVVEAMANAGRMMAEGGLVKLDGGEVLTPESAQRELAAINARIGRGEQISEAETKRRSDLYKIAYPGTQAA